MKRWAAPAVVAVALSAMVLSGCSTETKTESENSAPPTSAGPRSGTAPSVDVTDAAALIDQAAKNTRLASSVHLSLKVADGFKGLPVKNMEADVVTKPNPAAKGSGDFHVDSGDKQADFVIVDGTLYMKEAGETEYKTAPAGQQSYDPSVVLSEDKGLANLLTKFKNPKIAATEEHNGVRAVKVTGTLDSADFEAIFPTQGPGALTGEHPATAWIAEASPNNLVEITINTQDGDIGLTTSKWEEPVTITKP